MNRLLVFGVVAALCGGCAVARPGVSTAPEQLVASDLAVAGWRVPFECLEVSERIEASQARLYDNSAGAFSTVSRASSRPRVRS